jgi:NAD(P)H-hydrate epimerase
LFAGLSSVSTNEMSELLSRLPRSLYTAAQVREIDRLAIESGTPGIELMRRAAQFSLDLILTRWPQVRRLVVWTGSGNNAGDGFLLATLALDNGLLAEVIAVANPARLSGDAASAYGLAREAGVAFNGAAEANPATGDVWVDALLGIGISRELSGDYLGAVERINAAQVPVFALDCPSGLCADTGSLLGAAVVADATASFVGVKRGLLTHRAGECVGELHFSELGIQSAVFAAASAPAAGRCDVYSPACALPRRSPSSHKGSHGHVVVVGGDTGYGGASLLAAEAALHAGAGLVSIVTRTAHRAGILARRPEIMCVGTEDDEADGRIRDLLGRASAVVVGPGLGRSAWGRRLWREVLACATERRVIDADALFFLAEEKAVRAAKARAWVLTPHPGEAATLLAKSIAEVQADRFASVSELQARYGGNVLIKGAGSVMRTAQTVDAPARTLVCSEGNAGMAVGGMGDVLSGIIGALLAQGLDADRSLEAGVCLHGEAGDIAARRHGQRGLLPSELIAELRSLVN